MIVATVIGGALVLALLVSIPVVLRRRAVSALTPDHRTYFDRIMRAHSAATAANEALRNAEARLAQAADGSLATCGQCRLGIGLLAMPDGQFPISATTRASVEVVGQLIQTGSAYVKSRTTATRVVAGAVLGGGVGAIVGAAAKKNKVRDTTQVVDTRQVILNVVDTTWSSVVSFPFSYHMSVRAFANAINTAYPNIPAAHAQWQHHYSSVKGDCDLANDQAAYHGAELRRMVEGAPPTVLEVARRYRQGRAAIGS